MMIESCLQPDGLVYAPAAVRAQIGHEANVHMPVNIFEEAYFGARSMLYLACTACMTCGACALCALAITLKRAHAATISFMVR